MNYNHQSSRRLACISMLVTMATVLHVFEGLLPSLAVPGARLGLANIITLTTIVFFNPGDALIVAVARIILGSLFGFSVIGLAMSLAGGLLSWALMSLINTLWPKHFNLIGISLVGAASHNLAQLAVASLYLEEIAILSLLPLLMIFALPTGIMVGLVSGYLAKALEKIPIFRP